MAPPGHLVGAPGSPSFDGGCGRGRRSATATAGATGQTDRARGGRSIHGKSWPEAQVAHAGGIPTPDHTSYLPGLGSLSVADIRKADMARFHASMAKTPSGANFALAVLSKFMRWCEDMGYRTEQTNPCRGLTKYRTAKRERFLSRDEFARLGDVLREAELNQSASLFAVAAIRLLILTGARLNEILTLQWKHVDLERRLLLLPELQDGPEEHSAQWPGFGRVGPVAAHQGQSLRYCR